MDYEFFSQVLKHGGVEAVETALEDFAGRACGDELDAAVDVACRVIADDTARIKARGERDKAVANRLAAEAAELEWQLVSLSANSSVRLLKPADRLHEEKGVRRRRDDDEMDLAR
ncbi:hypothetical protein ACIPSJ_51665 [Streptomyces sp. NPDC090088]|uniref:hypothetical protein n=1 Tax=Streptomyces sp. NPDC090088 TaxID=3365944 RepID=UPI003828AA68